MLRFAREALYGIILTEGFFFQPCTIRDFMNYLVYVERAAENLQFYLWYKDYVRRFSAMPEDQQRLSPLWTKEDNRNARARLRQPAPSLNAESEHHPTTIENSALIPNKQGAVSVYTAVSTPAASMHADNESVISAPRCGRESVDVSTERTALNGGEDNPDSSLILSRFPLIDFCVALHLHALIIQKF